MLAAGLEITLLKVFFTRGDDYRIGRSLASTALITICECLCIVCGRWRRNTPAPSLTAGTIMGISTSTAVIIRHQHRPTIHWTYVPTR